MKFWLEFWLEKWLEFWLEIIFSIESGPRSQLVPDNRARAYACGCSKASPRELRAIAELNPDLKWVCMKH